MLPSHPSTVLLTSFSSSPGVGNPLCVPRESQKQQHTALLLLGWSCSAGWGSSSTLLGQEGLGQPCWGCTMRINMFIPMSSTRKASSSHPPPLLPFPLSQQLSCRVPSLLHAALFSRTQMPALKCVAVRQINGGIFSSKIPSLSYKRWIFWLKHLLIYFSSFWHLTPQLTVPILHIPESLCLV